MPSSGSAVASRSFGALVAGLKRAAPRPSEPCSGTWRLPVRVPVEGGRVCVAGHHR